MLAARLIGSWLLVAFPVACTSNSIPGPPAGLAHAAATPTCAPTDGPAVAIYLAAAPVGSVEPPAPYLRIDVWQPLGRLAGRSWVLAGSEAEGSAWFYSTATDFEIATRGRVTINAVAPDNTIEGSADLTFPSAGRIRGGFRAAWLSRVVGCV
jgi:hypothetical protein